MADLPDASVKLRTVLDYLPCEACLAQPVRDQDVLCSICRRLDRQVGVRVSVRRTVLVERPSEPEPVVIPPPAPAAPAAQPLDVVLAGPGEALPEPRPGVAQVVLEPLAPPAPPEEPEPSFDDLVAWEPPGDAFEYLPPAPAAAAFRAPEPEPVPREEFVFAPPPPEPEPEPAREPEAVEDWMPTEEAAVQQEEALWAPPPQEEPPEPVAAEAEPVEEILQTEVVEDEPVEMEVLPDDEPAPRGDSDLWRLRGFDAAAESALAGAGVTAVSHLAGHDPGELAQRTGLDAARLARWVQVADLNQDAGVPLDSAIALVTAGVAGPRGLREMDAETVVERTRAFGGADVSPAEVKRWKRRV